MRKILVITTEHPIVTESTLNILKEDGFEIEASGLSKVGFDHSNNILALHKEYSELEMILNLIEIHKDEDLSIYVNDVYKEDYFRIEAMHEAGYRSINIKGRLLDEDLPDVNKYYVPFYDNNWNPDNVAYCYREFSDKSKLLPPKFFNEPYTDIRAIYVPRGAGSKLIESFRELHKNGYNFTRFGKATYYPLAIMLTNLVLYMEDKNGSN